MRNKVVLMAGGLIALLLSAAACSSGSKATAGAPATNAATPGAKPAAGSTAAAGVAAGGAAAGGTVDVCSLMTSAQASSINSVTYGATKPQHLTAGYDQCTYTNTGQHADPVDIQDLTVQVISVAGCYAQLQQADGPGKAVTGIGDSAFGYSIGIVVKDGDRCVDVSGLTGAELRDDYSHDVAMAKIIIAALH